jgi:hypothetical protein
MLAKAVIQKQSGQGSYPKVHAFDVLVEHVAQYNPSQRLPELDDHKAADLIASCAREVRYGADLPCLEFAAACNQLEPLIEDLLSQMLTTPR